MQQHGKILIVEDEPLIRMAISEILIDEGFMVLEASNVLEAVSHLMTHPDISVLFTDIDMPGDQTGLDLARLARQSSATIGILVTSGGHRIEPGELAAGAIFIPKPYSCAAILSAVERLGSLLGASHECGVAA